MPAPTYDLTRLFRELDGQTFDSYWQLDSRVQQLFAQHRLAFPMSYDHRTAIRWARERGLVSVEGQQLRVHVSA